MKRKQFAATKQQISGAVSRGRWCSPLIAGGILMLLELFLTVVSSGTVFVTVAYNG